MLNNLKRDIQQAVSPNDNQYRHLCHECKTLFTSNETYQLLTSHQGNRCYRKLSVLTRSALDGCWLCRDILTIPYGYPLKEAKFPPKQRLEGLAAAVDSCASPSIKALCLPVVSHLSTLLDPKLCVRFNIKPDQANFLECTRSQWWHGRRKLDFEILVHSKDPAAQHVSNRPINRSVVSVATYNTIQQWLTDCNSKHSKCHDNQTDVTIAPSQPTRILNISRIEDPMKDTIRVEFVSPKNPIRYAALSYCWGGPQTNALTTLNCESHFKSIDITLLPRTIRHAVLVARALNLQYLWVDSMCIVQDSEQDKGIEIGRMDSIYFNAYVTILASCASSSDQGFLHYRESPLDLKTVPFGCEDGQTGAIMLTKKRPNDAQYYLPHEPVDYRAWTFQEGFMSRRMLIFSQYQLFWVCSEHWGKDGGRLTRRGFFNKELSCRVLKDPKMWNWTQIVETYSIRGLSDPHDKLPGLSSIASYFAKRWNDTYVAGMWASELVFQLCWQTGRRYDSARSRIQDRWSRPPKWRAPSWSFLSIDGPIHFLGPQDFKTLDPRYESICSVLSYETVPMFKEAPFGRLLTGSITLRGRLYRYEPQWQVLFETPGFYLFKPYSHDKTVATKLTSRDRKPYGRLWYDVLGEPTEWEPTAPRLVSTAYGIQIATEPVWCLPIYSKSHLRMSLGEGGAPDVITDYYGPALAKLPDGTFHRVGIFERSEDRYPNRREKMAPLENITII